MCAKDSDAALITEVERTCLSRILMRDAVGRPELQLRRQGKPVI